jgi:ABC-type phosphate/phosphonate transport system substrate-binding protein
MRARPEKAVRPEAALAAVFSKLGVPGSLSDRLGSAIVLAVLSNDYNAVVTRLESLEVRAAYESEFERRLAAVEAKATRIEAALVRRAQVVIGE